MTESRLQFAYTAATKEAKKQGKRHKKRYDLRVRESRLEIGDRVLMKNVGLKGKQKLADKWNKEVYVILAHENPCIPVYTIKREHGKAKSKIVHRNLLLPFTSIPLNQPRPVDHVTVDVETPIQTDNSGISASNINNPYDNLSSVTDVPNAENVDKYIIPA